MLVKIKDFSNSIYFIYAVGAVVALTWLSGWEIAGIFILLTVAATSLLLQRSFAPFLAITFMLQYCISMKQLPQLPDINLVVSQYLWLVILAAAMVLYVLFCVVFHLVKFPYEKENRFNLTGTFLLCLAALFAAGLFSEQFNLGNNLFLFTTYLMVFLLYLVYSTGSVKNMKEYVAHLVVVVGLIMVFEATVFFIRCDNVWEALEFKRLDLGWGVANNLATMFCYALVMAIYFYLTKNKSIYFFLAALFGVGVLFMFSRGNLLSLGLSAPFLLWFIFAKCQSKKKTAILIGIIVGIAAIVAIIKWDVFLELSRTMLWDKGTSNGDRRELWGDFANLFRQNMLFGGGFYESTGAMYKPHSILLIIASGMGLFGLIVFGYHYYKKYLVLFTYKSTFSIAVLFVFYFLFMYTIVDMTFHVAYQNILIIALLEAAKQERGELVTQNKQIQLAPKYSAIFAVLGLVFAVLATLCLANKPVLLENGHYSLAEVPHFFALGAYMVGGVLVFYAIEKLLLYFKTKSKPDGI